MMSVLVRVLELGVWLGWGGVFGCLDVCLCEGLYVYPNPLSSSPLPHHRLPVPVEEILDSSIVVCYAIVDRYFRFCSIFFDSVLFDSFWFFPTITPC